MAKGLAPGWPNCLGVIGSTDCAEKMAKLFTDPRGFGHRSPNESIDTDRPGLSKFLEPVDGICLRDLDQSIPIPEHFKNSHLGWSESLVATPCARRTTHQMNWSRITRGTTWHGDRVVTRNLSRESQSERGTPSRGTAARHSNEFISQSIHGRRSHPKARRSSSPVQAPPNPADVPRND
jgi:hypothetical protein